MSHGDMKALVLSSGKGTRLRPLTNTTTKQLLPVANRPILFYIMDMVREAGIADIGLVVSSEWGDQVEQAIGDSSRWNARITYVLQPEPAGLAHAVKIARQFLGNSPFLMILGDNVYKCDIKGFVAQFQEQSIDALLLVKEVNNTNDFGIAELNAEGKVVRVQEKPQKPRSNLALAGIYLFSSAIHRAIDFIKPSPRGELEITDAIQKLIEMGKEVRSHILTGWWLDTGKKDDLLRANRAVLDEFLKPDIRGKVDSGSQVVGKVEIMRGAVIEDSTIRGPVSIAENCRVKNSFIGPFTSIGKGTVIEASSVEHSVILENCRIYCIERLADSLLGKGAELVKGEGRSKAIRLFIGDDAKVEL